MDKSETAEIYNIVGEERDVLSIANRISQLARGRNLGDGEIEYIEQHKARPGHDLRYALDGAKLKEMGWQPKFTFDESFDKMIKWMMEHKRWLDL